MNTYILNYKRTPIGSFLSNYKNTSINDLSKQCLDNLLHDFDKKLIDKIYIGNVLSSGLGQNIARQIGVENDIDVFEILNVKATLEDRFLEITNKDKKEQMV